MRRVAVVLLLALAPTALARAEDAPTAGPPTRKKPAPKPARHRTPRPPPSPRPQLLPADPEAGGGVAEDLSVRPSGAPHAEGEYGGVVPGVAPAHRPEEGRRHRRAPLKGQLSWIGFQAKDGGAQLFFQSAGPFELSQRVEGGVLVAHLAGLSGLGPNTQRTVDTRYFDNPLAGIVAHRVGARVGHKGEVDHPGGVEVRLTFKNPREARQGTVRTSSEPDGLFYAYLDLGEGAEGTPAQ
jgi:hypothetical protein